jgi:F0F1-type ATP synthase membrane subunit c/vacuolar-type H+-ATPase subunit K
MTSHGGKPKKAKTTTMKTKLTKMIMSSLAIACALGCLVAAMALGTSGTARATAQFPQPCSVQTLNGLYLWTFDGYQNFGGNFVPKAVMQGLRFNGDGTTFNPFGTVNIGGTIIIDATGGPGIYTVAADCTGTLSPAPGIAPTFNIYVGPGAQQIWTLETSPNPAGIGVSVGTAVRVP